MFAMLLRGLIKTGAMVGYMSLVAGWLALLPEAAGAQARDVFSVVGVAVDATAETATAAREEALMTGQRDAFYRLLRRLTPQSSYHRHPLLDDDTVTALIDSFEIADEKRSSTRYLASLSIRFKRDEVRALLRRQELPFSETPSKPVLILPVYEAAGARNLWDDPNPWRVAWQGLEGRDSFVPLVVPYGDLTDVGTVGAPQALAGNAKRLQAIAKRYGVADVLVAHAVLRRDLAAGVPVLVVSLRRSGPSGEATVVESFRGGRGEGIHDLLGHAAGAIARRLEEDWKLATRLQFESEGRLAASVPLGSLSDWIVVRDRLGAMAEIRKLELAEISSDRAQVVLHYLGSPRRLAIALAQRDLALADENGFWVVRRRDGGPQPAAKK
ncbi:MAG: hypothetical protein CMM08_01635 [Rhodospirillaceae bacterium]|jgi:hypothetical protein|nr:hypothetical protein [Rhodospirillaceae bacterium]|tara:strand:- start:240 stop:1391 length:1152 start_codon:yes stop_codon:yes gene_type:complete